MRILIVEDEIYLAQSISGKLLDYGHECDIFATVNDALAQKGCYDVILLSTNLSGQDFYPVIKRFKDEIILLMVSYISNDTVTDPLKYGALDYIQKPFMIEELIRKINHYHEYKRLKQERDLYEEYMAHQMKNVRLPEEVKCTLPLMIKTNYQKQADAFVFAYAKRVKRPMKYIPLSDSSWLAKLEACEPGFLIYMPEFQTLKKSEKKLFLSIVKDWEIISSTTESFDEDEMQTLELMSEHKIFDRSEILTIDDYVKFIIHIYQNKFPDTELSKKLG
ncbi:MAG: response regulator, partial [Hydrogenimonas sp.]|nr:response regulator [Hydrogenimonas sp.]